MPSQLIRRLALPLAALLLSGCTAQMAYNEGRNLAAQDKIEAALVKYQQAIAAEPTNPRFRSAYLTTRDRNATRLLEQAERALAAGRADMAQQDYRRVLAIDPANERARQGLRALEADLRHSRVLGEAQNAFNSGDMELARSRVQSILTERPGHEPARQLMLEITDKTSTPAAETGLSAAYRQPISLEFRDAPLKQVFEVVSRRSGLNFLFDKDVKTDQRTSIFLKNSTVEAAVHFLLVTNQLEQQVMDGNTILVYPNVVSKLREYQETTIKTFFLANADAKTVGNTLKTILKSRDVVVDEKLNLVIVRDNPDAIKLAAKLVALQDVAEPEVMLEVEILEIKRSRLVELGIAWPSSVTLTPLVGGKSADGSADGGPITLDQLRRLTRNDIGISGLSATANANKIDGDSNTLANPRIRVRNREKAKVVIGDKVPNVTTTISPGANGFASESVTYLDVGLTLNVEPTIYLNNEIAIRISLQVSNLVGSTTTKSGTTAYQIGTREASTMLQLKDGENQVLAGLINNEDRESGNKIPLLGDIPILGRLFGSQRDTNDKTEIVLSITPHLIRNIQRPSAAASEFNAGTESSFRRRPDTAVRAPVVLPPNPGQLPPGVPQNQPMQQPQMPAPQMPLQPVPPVPALPAAAPVTAPGPAQPIPVTSPEKGAIVTPIATPDSPLKGQALPAGDIRQ
ncbi:general secretion pathway protein GspD [Massilia sp. PAMC28688]|uniref:secretin N-terminal domain-containing protein n=1 Tax=Massilia sp. PAMC28688 TaxID=2861283 RepID=UPI001C627482|nr:secretin N-terminal domain-containing protein [Massilia sp. PAMC28688]QYF93996.1 general secretion pathway protein GspD [Massilia sp. PAMC28688]